MIAAFRDYLFGLTLALSLALHAAAALWFSQVDFEPPAPIAPQQGKASIRLQARADAQPRPAERPKKETPKPPEPAPAEALALPELLPLPVPSPIPAQVPEPMPTERAVKRPEPQPLETPPTKPEPAKQKAKMPSVPSPASEAAQGAVDELPREAINPAPPYPPEARAAGQEGTVWVRIKIDATGKVAAARIYGSSGVDSLDDAALRTVRRWVFRPARRNGQPVVYEVLKPFEFSIRRGY